MLLCVEDRGLVLIIDRPATTVAACIWAVVRAEYEAQQEHRQPLLVSELYDVRQGASESYTGNPLARRPVLPPHALLEDDQQGGVLCAVDDVLHWAVNA